MSDPAALLAVPDQIRALRAFVSEHTPKDHLGRGCAAMVDMWLIGAAVSAECLIDALPAADRVRRPPQQIHAPLVENAEPCVPRRSSHHP